MYDPNHSFMLFNSDWAFTPSYITPTSNETVDEPKLVVYTIIATLEMELGCFHASFMVLKNKGYMIKMILSIELRTCRVMYKPSQKLIFGF